MRAYLVMPFFTSVHLKFLVSVHMICNVSVWSATISIIADHIKNLSDLCSYPKHLEVSLILYQKSRFEFFGSNCMESLSLWAKYDWRTNTRSVEAEIFCSFFPFILPLRFVWVEYEYLNWNAKVFETTNQFVTLSESFQFNLVYFFLFWNIWMNNFSRFFYFYCNLMLFFSRSFYEWEKYA